MEAEPLFTDSLTPTPSAWSPGSPSRSPAWRWLRAQWMIQKGEKPSPDIDDSWVLRARDFMAARLTAEAKPASRRTADRLDPAILGAVALVSEPESLRRSLLEAYLLTTEPLDEVARRCDLQVDVVEAFHALYFAVRDRPKARDWIMINAIRSGPWNDFVGQPAGLLRYVGLAGGARALDIVVAVTTNRPFPDWVRATWSGDAEKHDRNLRLRVKLALALMTTRTPSEVQKLIALRDQLDRLDRLASGRTEKLLRLQARWLKSLGRRRRAGRSSDVGPPEQQLRYDARTGQRRRRDVTSRPIKS